MNSIKNNPQKIVGGGSEFWPQIQSSTERGLQCSSFLHEGWCQARLGMTHDWL